MMPSKGSQVVFVIHPKKCAKSELKEVFWQDFVCESIAKLLLYLESVSSQNSKWNLNGSSVLDSNHDLKWGYRFANNCEIKFHSLWEFRNVNFTNLQLLYNEIQSKAYDELIDYTSHTLLKNLSSIVHDFQWERLEIFSPIKKTQKFEKINTPKSTKTCCSVELNDNIVVVIGPLPQTQEDLNSYFEWQINTVDDIRNILMPKHLSQLFRYRHNIRLFWLDTQERNYDQILGSSKLSQEHILMNEFLKLNGGCVIPFSMLGILSSIHSNLQHQPALEQKKQSRLSYCLFSDDSMVDMDMTVGSDGVFEDAVESKEKVSSIHCLPASMILNSFFRSEKLRKPFNDHADCIDEAKLCSKENIIRVDIQDTIFDTSSFNHCILNCYKSNDVKNENLSDVCNSHHILFCNSDYTSQNSLIFETTVKDDLCHTNENNARKLSCQINIIGSFQTDSSLLSDCLCGESCLCKPQVKYEAEFRNFMKNLKQTKQVLLVELHYELVSYETDGSISTFEPSTIFNRYGVMQALSDSCGSISWFREYQKRNVLDLLKHCFDQNADKLHSKSVKNSSEGICRNVDFGMGKANDDVPLENFFLGNDMIAFDPSMLESWQCMLSTSTDLKIAFENTKDPVKTSDKNNDNTEFRDGIMSALQQLYATRPQQEDQKAADFLSSTSNHSEPDLNSWEEVQIFICRESDRCIEEGGESFELMKIRAGHIVSVVYSFVARQEVEAIDLVSATQAKLEDHAFLSAAKLRCKAATSSERHIECMFQVFLRLEWISFSANHICHEQGGVEWSTDDVCQLLRMISLSQSVGKMKEFLCNVLVQFYTKTFGDLLVELHNDLMIPLPPALVEFSFEREAEDSFLDTSVRSEKPPSTGPFSLRSSVGSHESFDSQPNKKRFHIHKSQHIKPIISKQIEVPHSSTSRYGPRHRSVASDAVKRLFASTTADSKQRFARKRTTSDDIRSPNKRSSFKSVSQDVIKVRRDLFTSPRKRRKKTNSQSSRHDSPVKKNRPIPRSKRSVIDTPAAKQRLTALARQRLRMRRSWNCQEEVDQTVVEESPLKHAENHTHRSTSSLETKTKRSPRHSIMLTRRHSFYKDGSYGNCRTVARAKVVQLHKEAVPPTPRTTQPSFSAQCKEESAFSPKTLLFSYVRPSASPNESKPVKSGAANKTHKTRRKLKLVSEQNSKSLTTEVIDSLEDTHYIHSHDLLKQSSVTLAQKCESLEVGSFSSDENRSPGGEKPFQSYDVENNAIDVTSAPDAIPNLPPLQHKPLLQTRKSFDNLDPIRSPPKLMLARQSVARRSPRLASKVNEEKPIESPTVGPLDQFVIRTPTPGKKVNQNRTPVFTSSKKPSPNGDHIQKWPRKKRISTNTSPARFAKRRRKSSLEEKKVLSPNSNFVSSKLRDCLKPSESDVSPGVEVGEFLKSLSPRKKPSILKTSRSRSTDDIGVFPISEPVPTRIRWTSPRRKHTGTLYRASVDSGKSFVPLVLLHDDSE